jgi:hypothetical protein
MACCPVNGSGLFDTLFPIHADKNLNEKEIMLKRTIIASYFFF